jgi:multiple sugar transport system permease protein
MARGNFTLTCGLALFCAVIFSATHLFAAETAPKEKVRVVVWELPTKRGGQPMEIARYRVLERFQQLFPHIELVGASKLKLEGDVMDAAPLMAIAGGTSPDIIYVNFRQSDTYIRNGFLAPMDEYVAQMSKEEFSARVPKPVEPVIYRQGPDGKMHYYAMPYQAVTMVLQYRRDLFAAAGLDPEKPPQTWEELRAMARQIADPSKGIYGTGFFLGPQASWGMYSYLCSAGAKAVELRDGEWRAAFDSDEAVTAFEFVDDLSKDTVTKNGRTGPVAYRGGDLFPKFDEGKVAMRFMYLNAGQLADFNPQLIGVGPIPKGPTGVSSAEVNCRMMGIFAGQKDKRVRDAAWEYIRFVDSEEARKIFTQTMVEQGAWRMLSPTWLRQFGFPELAKLTPPGLEEAYETAINRGTPEPYGKNCQYVYTYLTKPGDEIFFTDFKGMSAEQKRAKIKEILRRAVAETNEKMIGVISDDVRGRRNRWAWLVAAFVVAAFAVVFWQVFRWMRQSSGATGSGYKTRYAVSLIAPALLLILMWQYYPLFRGSLMAVQDYRLLGDSAWVGMNNFGDVLADGRFWLSLKNAFYFCALWLVMGFLPPVLLAVMLQEIPRGKILFRVLFYLPAVASPIVILFMWRAIYDPSDAGILNKMMGWVGIPAQQWLADPKLAMVCLVFPLAWAHLGPGCLIYLAALKGVPDELYEASDIDGASFFKKLRYVVFPYLKPLLVINLVGATIFGFKSAEFVLAMTGGGPNLSTHVVGYEIWQRSFLYLHFGHGTAMAWIIGVLLLFFTAYQLRILNKVEFRTTSQ